VIVVIGNPVLVGGAPRPRAGGLPASIAIAAAEAGGDVQLVGKAGDDPAGNAALLDLGTRGVGHVALLRDPSVPTPAIAGDEVDEDAFEEGDGQEPQLAVAGPALEPADIELALSYLPDYRVLVVADPLGAASLAVVEAAIRWSGAALVVVIPAGAAPPQIDATVMEAPEPGSGGAFGAVVGRYAAALDRGEEPAEAFASASSSIGAAAPG
jgi:sugar/nucleoside kinase (ribokinase family)